MDCWPDKEKLSDDGNELYIKGKYETTYRFTDFVSQRCGVSLFPFLII